MEAIKVRSTKNNIQITIDKNIINEKDIMSLIRRLNIEQLTKEADFEAEVVELSKDIKHNIWEKVKKERNFIESV
jgi:hypothetical protein